MARIQYDMGTGESLNGSLTSLLSFAESLSLQSQSLSLVMV